jgi:4-hydroxybenzoate polyprenyltransferase
MENSPAAQDALYVDLDGTFLKTDLLFESLLAAAKAHPIVILKLFFWLIQGKAYCKYKVAQFANLSTRNIPLNRDFYNFLKEEKAKGRKIVLATASTEQLAKRICDDFDLFDDYICSDRNVNMKGATKLERIRCSSERFAYAGNASEDFVIFEQASESYLVNPTLGARRRAQNTTVTNIFDDKDFGIVCLLKQLRVHQWLKNSLIFVPLLTSGKFTESGLLIVCTLGWISFSFLSSATYIINDLLDIESDRSHFSKKYRPIASGQISIFTGIAIFPLLVTASFGVAASIGFPFALSLLAYLALTLSYSLKLKQFIGIDVITLASLYTIRIIAGTAILNSTVSFWLLSFSMFIFFSLALIKRCSDLKILQSEGQYFLLGRDYNTQDYPLLMTAGVSSGFVAVLMLCLYINSEALTQRDHEPQLLWLTVPALCYWIMRMWIKTHRGEMHVDPIVFTLRDKGGLATILFMGLVTFMAQIT